MSISYTEEEIQKLYDSLQWHRLRMGADLLLKDIAYIQVAPGPPEGEPAWDNQESFTRSAFLDLLTKRKYKKPTSLELFVQEVPFEEVPLYLNTYPELAKWRLNIAK